MYAPAAGGRCCASPSGGRRPDGGLYRRRRTTPVHPAGAVGRPSPGQSRFRRAGRGSCRSAHLERAGHPELLVLSDAADELVPTTAQRDTGRAPALLERRRTAEVLVLAHETDVVGEAPLVPERDP